MKKILILLLFLSLIIFSSCGKRTNAKDYKIHTESQSAYLLDKYDSFASYASGQSELSLPNPIVLDFSDLVNPTKLIIKEGNNSLTYDIKDNELSIYNLKINTVYKYDVYDNNNQIIKTENINVDEDIIRNLYIDGLTNVRDLGGYKTTNKKEVKQGLIYRSSKLNDDKSTNVLITEKGINTFVNELKLKTELDLRKTSDNENGGITESVIGSSVTYISIPMKSSGNCLTLNKNEFKKVFEVLGNKDNYPIDIHCSIGTDRTGVVCFLINAVLGVSEEDLYRDYLFSNFGMIYDMRTPSAIVSYLEVINQYEGKTLSDRTYNYLIDVGVSENDIKNLKKIMLK